MTPAFAALVLAGPFAAVAPPTRPAAPPSLTVPAADLDRAAGLIRFLGSDDFRDRDRATRELRDMGRRALPVLARAAGDADDAEVRGRAAGLLRSAEADDVTARLAAFLADAANEYDHGLPGWAEFRAAAGDSPTGRALFAELYKSPENRDLMAAFGRDKADLARRLADRKADLYARMNVRVLTPAANRYVPAVADVVPVLLAEAAAGDRAASAPGTISTISLVYGQAFRAEIAGGKFRDPVTDVVHHWLGARTDTAGLSVATSVASNLGLPDGVKYPLRLLKQADVPGPTKANAMVTVAKLGGRKHLADLTKFFADETVIRTLPNRPEVQTRDLALAMALVVLDKDPTDFGFVAMQQGAAAKFYYYNYSLPSAEAREKAFEKWKAIAPKAD